MTESSGSQPPASQQARKDRDPAHSEAGAAPEPAVPKREKRRGRGAVALALFALLVALAAAVATVGLGYVGQQQIRAFDARVTATEQTLESNIQDLLIPRLETLEQQVTSLSRGLEQQAGAVDQLRGELRESKLQTAKLAELVKGGAGRWALLEIEDLLRTANTRLLLYRDPQAALRALELASRRLGQLNDPRLFAVREQIIDEIASLNALPDPDIQGMAMALGALIEQVPDWPLASRVPANYAGGGGPAEPPEQTPADVPAWRHFLDSLGQAMQGMFTIRRTDSGHEALLPPGQEFFLVQNLQLKLQAARLALLQHRAKAFHSSLVAAQQWLRTFFDTGAPAVDAAIKKIGQLEKTPIQWRAPDITGSLVALREFLAQQAQSGPTKGAAPADSKPAPAATAPANNPESS